MCCLEVPQQSSFTGKTQAIFSEKLTMCRFLENRARIGQKIQYADFKANSGGFRSEIKCLGVLSKPMQFSVRNLNMQILGTIPEFFGEISAKSGIWMKCSHRSHDVRTTCFFQAVCSHGCSHVFTRFSHDLLFQGFLFARMFARFARVRTMFARRP